MSQKSLALLLSIVILYIVHSSYGTLLCPNAAKIEPCVCNYNYVMSTTLIERFFNCRSLMAPEDLERSLKASRGLTIKELKIEGSALRYFTEDTFKEHAIKQISIFHSNLQALSNSDFAFQGLEDSLKRLQVENVSFVSNWDWSKLSKLTKLNGLYIGETDLQFLPDSFKLLPKTLKVLVIYRNPLSELADGIFESFTELELVKVQRNHIQTVKRNMFPKPAAKLTLLDLSNNGIHVLPSDIFTEMPVLETLSLSGNSITTLDQSVFEKVLPQITGFFMNDSPLTCDCRMSWLVESKLNSKMEKVYCKNPPYIAGRALSSLEAKDLWCYH